MVTCNYNLVHRFHIITFLTGTIAITHKLLVPSFHCPSSNTCRSFVKIPFVQSGKSKSQLLDLFQTLFTVQSKANEVLVEHQACKIGVHTCESHTLRDDCAGHDLSAVKRSER